MLQNKQLKILMYPLYCHKLDNLQIVKPVHILALEDVITLLSESHHIIEHTFKLPELPYHSF